MKRYEKYKDSGVEWIGEIPNEWKLLRLKHIVEQKITDGPHETPVFVESGVPFLSAESIKGNKIDLKSKRGDISQEQHSLYAKKSQVKKWDILFCKSGSTTGKSAIVDFEEEVGIWSPLAIIRSKAILANQKYVFASMQSIPFRLQVETAWTFGTQPNIGMGSLENLFIVLPSLSEQTVIANYLDQKTTELDTLITKKERLIELLQEERTAIINQAVTKGLDPDVEMKDSGVEWLGEIPAHWDSKPLRYVGDTQNGISAGAEYFGLGFPFVSYGDVYKNPILPNYVSGLANSTEKERSNFSVKKGDVLFTRTSETVEEIGIASTCLEDIENVVYAGFLIRFRPYENLLFEGFSKYYFRNNIHRIFFIKEMNIVTRASLSQGLLKRLRVLLPGIQEQIDISNYLDNKTTEVDNLISKTNQEITLLKEYKTALISEVVTGKVKVI